MPRSMFHRDFGREIPFSQLSRELTATEESGVLNRELGLHPRRLQQPSHDLLIPQPSSVRFVHPEMPRSPSPRRICTAA